MTDELKKVADVIAKIPDSSLDRDSAVEVEEMTGVKLNGGSRGELLNWRVKLVKFIQSNNQHENLVRYLKGLPLLDESGKVKVKRGRKKKVKEEDAQDTQETS